MWIVLVLIYGLCKGLREIFKKTAFKKNSVMEILFMYSIVSFVMVLPEAGEAFRIPSAKLILPIIAKAAVIFVAWTCNFNALNKMPISLYGVLDLSRVLFSTGFGIILLSESMSTFQIIGLVLVCAGLLMLKIEPHQKDIAPRDKISAKTIFLAFVGCGFNAFSGTLDKILMSRGDITSAQLQFWYSLFLLAFYAAYMLATKTPFKIKSVVKNYWVYLMSATLVLGDRVLFIANSYPECKVTIMTLIKQVSCIVIILGGKFIFKEKRTAYKLFCAVIIILGIVIAVIKK